MSNNRIQKVYLTMLRKAGVPESEIQEISTRVDGHGVHTARAPGLKKARFA